MLNPSRPGTLAEHVLLRTITRSQHPLPGHSRFGAKCRGPPTALARATRDNPPRMATIRKEILIDTTPEAACDALRDIGALHTRLVAGFVTDTKLEGNVRTVTFGNGTVVREEIVSVDPA